MDADDGGWQKELPDLRRGNEENGEFQRVMSMVSDGESFQPKSLERNNNLKTQCQFFMVKRTHVRTEVREEAKIYLHDLLSKNA